jgi:O-acetyl-ADP-ribose deacetylase (regulator of RNase III)
VNFVRKNFSPKIMAAAIQSQEATEIKKGFRLIDKSGDLFESKHALAHCVSLCLRMGKGIATKFRNDFGCVEEMKQLVVDDSMEVPSIIALFHKPSNRFIYYLITKARYFDKPTYASLRACLEMLKDHMVANKVAQLSIPELGCGLDRLKWSQVAKDICDVFKDTNITITAYHFAER